jgi:hypothetical protein
MKHPIFASVLFIFAWSSLLVYDFLFGSRLGNTFDFLQNLAFSGFGISFGLMIESLKKGNKKPELIDPAKLAREIAEDESKQLREKIKTLEYALERLNK